MSIVGRVITVVVLAWLSCSPAFAQYPDQPIKAIVPYPAGGAIDAFTRVFTDRLSIILGKSIIVDNRPGAGGKVGEDAVSRATPDGYTLLINLALRPTLARATPEVTQDPDIVETFEIAGVLASSSNIMLAANNLGVKDFKSLIERMKAEPGKHSYGSPGPGTPSQILSAQIVKLFNLDIVHVPYRGGAPALADLVGGSIAWMIDGPGSSRAITEAGQVTPLWVNSSSRLKQMPNIPTITEIGYPQFSNYVSTVFLMAPKGTPRPILEKLNAALNEAQKDPEVIKRLDTLVLVPPPSRITLEQARTMAVDQIRTWEGAIQDVLKK